MRFLALHKCKGKFDCLILKMLFIKQLKPILNTQSDSIKMKTIIKGNSSPNTSCVQIKGLTYLSLTQKCFSIIQLR